MCMTSTIRRCRKMLPLGNSDVFSSVLTGHKVIFTNGTVAHAEKVLARIGISGHFSGIFDIVHSDYLPKPARAPYESVIAAHGIAPERAAMFEDIARNLEVPHALGMVTVLVTSPDNDDGNLINDKLGHPPHELAYVQHVTGDLARFLSDISGGA